MRIRAIRDVAAAVRGRRLDLGLSQAELARRADVSRKWISEFEAGKLSAEVGLVLRVIDDLGLVLDLCSDDEAAPPGAESPVDLDALLHEHRLR